jgi:peptide/nickel transport system substrate-binding protein
MNDPKRSWLEPEWTRREALRSALAGGAALSAGGLLAACGSGGDSGNGAPAGAPVSGKLKTGGAVRVGVSGGGAKDTVDAHLGAFDPDIARLWNLYESLTVHNGATFETEMLLAESIEPNKNATEWTVRLKPDIRFHDGKPVTADDVIFSFRRMLDPAHRGASQIGYVDAKRLEKLDGRTVRVRLKEPNVSFPEDIAEYYMGVVPQGYDPSRPVGTGPFRFKSFTPGERSVFTRNEEYWQAGKPYLDELTFININDDAARVNALLSGQVEAVSNLPASQVNNVKTNSGLRVLDSETGGWTPITMRVDQAPFDDPRVRQAFRLIANRKQIVDQALSGFGRVANDLYSPYDPDYNKDLPQREQDLEQAKSLLRQAGQSDLRIELVTAPVYVGVVESAQVFAEQAKDAGVNVSVRRLDSGTFYGDNYLKWTFGQDF